ncbi:hypothetical protein [uncultured Thiohalocapsa sp.]|uniref:hypothetical protein n=1 Tax=uncultured Thiohalocapsa sp. TaxID=768990 RepID=UPI00260081B5|nr:hypothetical protein [uncultured Thiohalocapsa sp.]
MTIHNREIAEQFSRLADLLEISGLGPKHVKALHQDLYIDKALGVRIAVSTDAHSQGNLDFMRFGVDQARRGWLTADDVINTRGLDDLLTLLRR